MQWALIIYVFGVICGYQIISNKKPISIHLKFVLSFWILLAIDWFWLGMDGLLLQWLHLQSAWYPNFDCDIYHLADQSLAKLLRFAPRDHFWCWCHILCNHCSFGWSSWLQLWWKRYYHICSLGLEFVHWLYKRLVFLHLLHCGLPD